jgi:hypothetical protein
MRGPRAPADRPRRDEIAAAVAAYDAANPFTPLPRNARQLLLAMFPAGDVCQRSLDAIAADGFSRRHLPGTLHRLSRAGFLSWERGAGASPSIYRLHLPPRRQP